MFPALLLNILHQLLYHQGFMPCPLREFVPLTDPPQSLFPKLPSSHRQLGFSVPQTRIGVFLVQRSERRKIHLIYETEYGLPSNFEQANESMYLSLSNRISTLDPKRYSRLKLTFNRVIYQSWSSLPGRGPSWGGRLRGPSSHVL